MAYLKEKIEQTAKALDKWKELQSLEKNEINRDAMIQRFEFSTELLWKTIKTYLKEKEGIECYSPKSCFREINSTLNLSDEEIEFCLEMVNDRNLASHIYSEKMADILYAKMDGYIEISEKILNQIEQNCNLN